MTAAVLERVQALYRFHDRAGELLYVGITLDPGKRWPTHRSKPWWTEVATITVEQYASRAEVADAERTAIETEGPRYNVIRWTHSARRGFGVPEGDYVMASEIAAMFGVTRQAADLWTRKPDFPEPAGRPRMGRIWRSADVVKWAEDQGRQTHE